MAPSRRRSIALDARARSYNRIEELDKESHKKSAQPLNQSRDARIAKTSIRNQMTLVTTDQNLTKASRENGGNVIDVDEFLRLPPVAGSTSSRQKP